jgi:hypothetical protein
MDVRTDRPATAGIPWRTLENEVILLAGGQ